jgi:hypothetical protein
MSAAKRQPRTDNPSRIQLLRDQPAPPLLNGIDYLEVTSKDQLSLKLVFVHDVSGITAAQCRIDGGVRIRGIRVLSATANGRELAVEVDAAGDFSWYDFVLFDPAAPDFAPAGIDPVLASVSFSFKAQCPSEFDCETEHECPPATLPEPSLDYLAKDYASFRRLMLDRMGQLMPGGAQNHPADFSVALVEMLAHVGDLLSYRQDAVATEAYLGTARRRVSLRRHARLLDYQVHEGCNSRAYVCLEIDPLADGQVLKARSTLLTRGQDPDEVALDIGIFESQDNRETRVFETMHALTLQSAHNRISIHAWGDPNFCLPRGATEAALIVDSTLTLAAGQVLIAEEVLSATTGRAADAERSHRHAIRLVGVDDGEDELTGTTLKLIRWHADDALPFPLCVSAEFDDGGATESREIAVMRGNVVLADEGATRAAESMTPPLVPPGRSYRPRLQEPGIAYAQAYDHATAVAGWSAARALQQDPRQATPSQMHLEADDPTQFGDQVLAGAARWSPQRDLLASDRFAQEFVVETESDGSAFLRFGDNRFGLRPDDGAHLLASYRQGGGAAGNVGPDSITRLINDDIDLGPLVLSVRNPLPAQGGTDPEAADAIKLYAPEAFRTQERAVTEADYARMAERHPQVQRAAARLRWTGSWYTMFVSIDRKGGAPMDDAFKALMLAHLDRYRLAGYDLELNDPAFVPLDIELGICVLPGYIAAAVKQSLLLRLSNGLDAQALPAFFHPDRFSFGSGVALSALVEAAQSTTGVASVDVIRFQRWGRTPNGEREEGLIAAAPLEVLRLDNDPNFPENGRLVLNMRGGL